MISNESAIDAIVLLSGGLDSATVLALARSTRRRCHTLSVAYGQRHSAELAAASRLSAALGAEQHRVVQVDIGQFGGSALTSEDIAVPTEPSDGIPVTYVPARNTIMLSLALGWAEVIDADEIHIGVNAVDYSGYPDCRPEFIAQFERLAAVATRAGVEGRPIRIVAPLLGDSKATIIKRGRALGVDYSRTVSCYQANEAGQACGRCDACRLRQAGFLEAGFEDPTLYQG